MTKIAILTPCMDSVKAHYAFSLAHLTAHMAREHRDKDIRPFMVQTSLLPKSRTMLAGQALEWGADWLFWVDSDHLFPPSALERLLAHDLDIVGANYPRRDPPHHPTATVEVDGRPALCETTADNMRKGLVEPVATMGMGLMLMRAAILRDLPRPWFAISDTVDHGFVGEDAYLLRKLAEKGHVAHVDHALSWEVGHIGGQVLSPQNRVG